MWGVVVQLLYWCCKSNIFHNNYLFFFFLEQKWGLLTTSILAEGWLASEWVVEPPPTYKIWVAKTTPRALGVVWPPTFGLEVGSSTPRMPKEIKKKKGGLALKGGWTNPFSPGGGFD